MRSWRSARRVGGKRSRSPWSGRGSFTGLLPLGDELLFVGGAGRGGHYADVERRALGGSALTGPEPAPDATPLARGDWPGFRGRGDSHAGTDLPVRWSEADVAWRVALPGYGQSSPVVWQGQVFVTSAVGPEKETLVLTAVDLETGEVRWRRRFSASQRLPATDTVSRAAPTPVVDATGVFAFWESGDVVATTHQGETLWKRSLTADYGDFAGNHGIGSSPVLTDAAVVVQVTHAGPSYFVALDKGTGANLWKADRDPGVAWSSPALLLTAAGARIVSSAAGRVEALDADTGESLWSLNGVEKNHVPSATLGDGLIVVASSEVGHNFALRPGATPDAPPVVAWRAAGVSSGFGSPLLHGGCALFVNKAGGVTCVDVGSGASLWKHRLADACWASPLASGDLAYFFTKKGVTVVLRTGAEGAEVVAKNAVATDDTVYGVAAVKGAFVVRTGSELARLGR